MFNSDILDRIFGFILFVVVIEIIVLVSIVLWSLAPLFIERFTIYLNNYSL